MEAAQDITTLKFIGLYHLPFSYGGDSSVGRELD